MNEGMGNIKELNISFSLHLLVNKAGYTAIPVFCGWAGAVYEVTRAFGQERQGHKA